MCTVGCGKKFLMGGWNKRKHEESCDGKGGVMCKVCGHSFKTKSAKSYHMKSH